MNQSDAGLTASMLEAAGFRVEGPGGATDGTLRGQFWWTLIREGWSGIECGPAFASSAEAEEDALAALMADEDLDWRACMVLTHAQAQFPPDFPMRMRELRSS